MTNVTIQDYANVLSRPHTLFWDGYCTSVRPHQKIRLALAAKKAGALGVLLVADTKRDIWLMTSGLHAGVRGNHITLTGANGLVLKLTFSGKSATGSLIMIVTEKENQQEASRQFDRHPQGTPWASWAAVSHFQYCAGLRHTGATAAWTVAKAECRQQRVTTRVVLPGTVPDVNGHWEISRGR